MAQLRNLRLTAKLARHIDRPDLKQKTVGVRYKSAAWLDNQGIEQSTLMGDLYHEGELIAVNVVLKGRR